MDALRLTVCLSSGHSKLLSEEAAVLGRASLARKQSGDERPPEAAASCLPPTVWFGGGRGLWVTETMWQNERLALATLWEWETLQIILALLVCSSHCRQEVLTRTDSGSQGPAVVASLPAFFWWGFELCLTVARQALYYLNHISSPIFFITIKYLTYF